MLTYMFFTVIFIIISIFLKLRFKVKNEYLIFFAIFYFYLIHVVKFTIFPIPITGDMLTVMRENKPFESGINMIPLSFKSPQYLFHKQLFLNVLLSIPFGFGISFITKISKLKLTCWSISFGFIIEGMQLLISLLLGFTYRYIDINDVLLNCLGVIIGYLIFKLFSIIFIKVAKSEYEKLNSYLKYIFDICKQKTQITH